jgi:hypothetical protein
MLARLQPLLSLLEQRFIMAHLDNTAVQTGKNPWPASMTHRRALHKPPLL